MRKRKSISIFRSISPLVWLLSAFSCSTVQAMQALADRDLAEVTGQALFVSDRIAPTGAAGSVTDFTFHRMGLDVELAIRNENRLTQREVAGIKIGAQSADGFIGIGRKYTLEL